jgi:hypothetical protein
MDQLEKRVTTLEKNMELVLKQNESRRRKYRRTITIMSFVILLSITCQVFTIGRLWFGIW